MRQGSKGLKIGVETEVSGELGWNWLAKAATRLKGSMNGEISETTAKQRVLAEPGPDLLIPVLQASNYILVIEDFHYLEDSEKVVLFQQWKRFIDNEVSVLILGTTHRAVDIANSNRDLIGRVAQFNIGHWEISDLKKITEQGFKHLGVKIKDSLNKFIATEAVGLPIVVQQVGLEIFISKDIKKSDEIDKSIFAIDDKDVELALHKVAQTKYTQFETYYSTLIRGPREKARKYKTYELVLACFTLNPIKFSLTRKEIDERLHNLGFTNDAIPPAASINSTLGALKSFQERRKFDLLEWMHSEEILYIIEPSFLFYVRWRIKKEPRKDQLDLFDILLKSLSVDNGKYTSRNQLDLWPDLQIGETSEYKKLYGVFMTYKEIPK